jgi:RHS repeat-associated protein
MLADHQGSIRQIVDNTGSLLNQITYDSYGNITNQTNPSVTFRFGYTGREWDGETGQYYYRARYYDARVGRFLSTDPIGFTAGDANLYRYVGNSPTNFTDPSGEYRIEIEYDPIALGGHHARIIFVRNNGVRIAYEAVPSIGGFSNAFRNTSGSRGTSGYLIPNPSTFGKIDYTPSPAGLNQFVYEKGCSSDAEEKAAENIIRTEFEKLIAAKIAYSTLGNNSNSAAFHALRTLLPEKYIYPIVSTPAWDINPFTGQFDPRASGYISLPEPQFPMNPSRDPGKPDKPTAF